MMPFEPLPPRALPADARLSYGALLALERPCRLQAALRASHKEGLAEVYPRLLGDAKHRTVAAILRDASGATSFADAVRRAGGLANMTRSALSQVLDRVEQVRGGDGVARAELGRVRGAMWSEQVRDDARRLAAHAWDLTLGRSSVGGKALVEPNREVHLEDGTWEARPDLVWETAGGFEITDYKTDEKEFDPSRHEPQLLFYAALWQQGRAACSGCVVRVLRPEGVAWERAVPLDELRQVTRSLRERGLAARARALDISATPSPDYCPSCSVRGACAAYWANSTLRGGGGPAVDREVIVRGPLDIGTMRVPVVADGAPSTLTLTSSKAVTSDALVEGARTRWLGLFERHTEGVAGLYAPAPSAHTALRGAEAWRVGAWARPAEHW
jgi:hypothetical protein